MYVKKSNFSKPPLTEALLDIKVNLASNFDVNALEFFQKSIEKYFPIKQINTKWETKLQIKPGESLKFDAKDSRNGFIFKTANNEKLVQARMDGFTFNRLTDYESWDSFKSESRKLWEIYLKVAKPISIKRLAVRYINTIQIPRPAGDLNEYFSTVPEISRNLPQMMTEFFMRVVIPEPNSPNATIVIETVDVARLSEEILPIIFDIDTFRIVDLKGEDKTIWEIFESLRRFRSEVFWKSLTKKTIALFK